MEGQLVSQALTPIQYEADNANNCTSFAGLPFIIDMAKVTGLCDAISQSMNIKNQGWSDQKIILSLILINISGGDCVDDVNKLESDDGFRRIILQLETYGMKRKERREFEKLFRKNKTRAFPSPTTIRAYLDRFHNDSEEQKRKDGKAFVPARNFELKALCKINSCLINFMQQYSPSSVATLDQDATLCETSKSNALYCYKKYKAYQPFNTYWSEQKLLLHSEFRDGNVPAGFQQLRLLKESLNLIPETVNTVYLRSDSAGYQKNLLKYCAEGENERFGVIEFAIAAPVNKGFKAAVSEVSQETWSPIYKTHADGKKVKTNQEWAEVNFTPSWESQRDEPSTCRYIAIREQLVVQKTLDIDIEAPSQKNLPFPIMEMNNAEYKLFAIATNRNIDGNELINWHRERCGDSEKIHSIEKTDLAGGQFPSGKFGANAAWWCIMTLSLNLLALMKKLVFPKEFSNKRIKAIRLHLIAVAGKFIKHARGMVIKVSGGIATAEIFQEIQKSIAQLAVPPPILSLA